MAAAPVTDPRVGLCLQGVQVGYECRRQAAARATQGRLGVLDDLPVTAQVERLVGDQCNYVPAESTSPEALAIRSAWK
jgi:hypothetical protein